LIRAGKYYDAEKRELVLVNGPARLTKFLKITGAQNGKIARKKTELWFEYRGVRINRRNIIASKRIGVDYASPIWRNKLCRFYLTT
jgi:DNA-3-methyladenine glycosylase